MERNSTHRGVHTSDSSNLDLVQPRPCASEQIYTMQANERDSVHTHSLGIHCPHITWPKPFTETYNMTRVLRKSPDSQISTPADIYNLKKKVTDANEYLTNHLTNILLFYKIISIEYHDIMSRFSRLDHTPTLF